MNRPGDWPASDRNGVCTLDNFPFSSDAGDMSVVRSAKDNTTIVINPKELNHLIHGTLCTVVQSCDLILITLAMIRQALDTGAIGRVGVISRDSEAEM